MDWKDLLPTFAALVTILLFFKPILQYVSRYKELKKWRFNEIKKIFKVLCIDEETSEMIKSHHSIKTMGQTQKPNYEESEPADDCFLLTEWLTNKISKSRNGVERVRYVLLGGTGMGKSTFLASFVNDSINNGLFNTKERINVYNLGEHDVLNKLSNLKDFSSVLVLDALDENIQAVKNKKEFWRLLLETIQKFDFVIITCRTQFFSDISDLSKPIFDPYNTIGPEKKNIEIERVYISPLSQEDVRNFLGNKYGTPSKEFSKSLEIVRKSKNLTARPLILAFMDFLLEMDLRDNLTNALIYDTIIQKWLGREISQQSKLGRSMTISELYDFSKKIAFIIYNNWQNQKSITIQKKEFDSFVKRFSPKRNPNPYSFEDRSLLVKDIDDNITFVHRSFWEFFIAIISIENPGRRFNPVGDMADTFLQELYQYYLEKDDTENNKPKFEYVKFYTPNKSMYVNSYKLDIPKYIDQLDKISQSKKLKLKEQLLKLLYYLLEDITNIMLSSGCFIENKFKIQRNIVEKEGLTEELKEEFINILKIHDHYLSIYPLFDNLSKAILNCFSIIGIKIDLQISLIKSLLYQIERVQYSFDITNYSSTKYFSLRTVVVLPCIYIQKELSKKILSNNLLWNGNGIFTKETIIDTIGKVSKDTYGPVRILMEEYDIDELVDFISTCAEQLTDIIKRCIFIIKNNGFTIYYLLNRETKLYDNEHIRNCISNLILYKRR